MRRWTISGTSPTLSVIIACVNGLPVIEECLTALAGQRGDIKAEVIVADSTGDATIRCLQAQFPWVRLLPFAERRTIPELRAMALAHSHGDIVVVIEDHCLAAEGWYEAIVQAHEAYPDCVAVGGVVENGSCKRLTDWAVFFCEYSTYMLPVAQGVAGDITGNNVSYKRRAFEGIEDLSEVLTQGFWESTLHPKLRARGETFVLEPAIVVYHKKHFGFRYFLSQRYLYSRYYTGTLLSQTSLARRLVRSAASLALPPLLMTRIASRVMQKGRFLREFVLSLPLLAVFMAAWSVGEAVGCLLGPGDSLSRVE